MATMCRKRPQPAAGTAKKAKTGAQPKVDSSYPGKGEVFGDGEWWNCMSAGSLPPRACPAARLNQTNVEANNNKSRSVGRQWEPFGLLSIR